jgi:hypothetical protein
MGFVQTACLDDLIFKVLLTTVSEILGAISNAPDKISLRRLRVDHSKLWVYYTDKIYKLSFECPPLTGRGHRSRIWIVAPVKRWISLKTRVSRRF